MINFKTQSTRNWHIHFSNVYFVKEFVKSDYRVRLTIKCDSTRLSFERDPTSKPERIPLISFKFKMFSTGMW